MWHITSQCCLQCKFCFARNGLQEVGPGEIQSYTDKFSDLMVQKVDISGGEPLAYPYLKEVCDALCGKGIFITLTTRGIGLQENIDWILKNSNKFVRIIVSVDVPDAGMFAEISGNKSAFGEMEGFIEKLKKINLNSLRINTVVTKKLLEETTLLKMIKWVQESGCKEWCLIEPHPANKKDTYDEIKVKHSEFQNVCRRVTELCGKDNCKILMRNISDYAGYWVLYADGILAKHTKGSRDTSEIDFLNADTEKILENIQGSRLWLPEGENMIYSIRNSESDEFVALILKEVGNMLKKGEGGVEGLTLLDIREADNGMKGLEIQEIVLMLQQTIKTFEPQIQTVGLGVIASGLFEILKNAINKYKKMDEYSAKKIIEIETEDEDGKRTKMKITLEEIIK